jgi:hypothetical protein
VSEGQTHCNNCGEALTADEMAGYGHGHRAVLICGLCSRRAKTASRGGWRPVWQWEGDGGEGLRLASRSPVPWSDRNVAMLCVSPSGEVRSAHTVTGKRQMLEDAAPGDLLLVAWPGQRRQSVFVVDDRRAAHRTLQRGA